MNREIWEVVSNPQGFIKALTDESPTNIERYYTEIELNREFQKQLEFNKQQFDKGRFTSWFPGIGNRLGEALYVICRISKPEIVIETGVAGGVSSSYILCALEENKSGKLYSIDLPWQGSESGWIIPGYLKHRWQLSVGRSSEMLLPLLEKLGRTDLFLHDSDHSYRNMLWEYETAWEYLKSEGLLLSHNINMSDAFPDFCKKSGGKGGGLL